MDTCLSSYCPDHDSLVSRVELDQAVLHTAVLACPEGVSGECGTSARQRLLPSSAP